MKYVIALSLFASTVMRISQLQGADSLFSTIVASLLMVPVIFLYNAILRLYPGKNLYDIIVIIFGNIIGKIICVLFLCYTLMLASLALNIFGEFVHVTTMDLTPRIVLAGVMIVLCVYTIYSGLASVGKLAHYVFPITVILIAVTVLVSGNIWNPDNLKPYLNSDSKAFMSDVFTSLTLPFGELAVFMTLFSSVDPKENYPKIFLNGLFIALLLMLVVNARNILILGAVAQNYNFVSYESARIVALGEFFTRIEIVVGVNIMISGFLKIVVSLFSSSIGLAKVLNITEYKHTAVPAALIVITLVGFLFRGLEEAINFVPYYSVFAFLFQVILPVIILVAGVIKKKMIQKKANSNLAEVAGEY